MNNSNIANSFSTANQDEFKMEVISLMKKIKTSIDAAASNIKSYQDQLSQEAAAHLNVLKIHEYKLKEILKWVDGLDDAGWIEDKEELVRDVEAAYKAFMELGKQ